MMNVREQIADVTSWCLYHDEHKFMADPAGDATDRIIAIVREALLSDEAVVRAVRLALFSMDMGDATEVDAQITVAAALDAAGLSTSGSDYEQTPETHTPDAEIMSSGAKVITEVGDE